MDEELFKFLENKVTIFGLKGINPNTATKEILMSLDQGITAEIADKLIARRGNEAEGGEYKSDEDFWNAVDQFGARLNGDPKEIPIVIDTLVSFRIKSTGVFGNVRTQIEAVVTDIDKVASRVSDYVKKEAGPPPLPPSGIPAQPPAPPTPAPTQIPPGPPRILYWFEY